MGVPISDSQLSALFFRGTLRARQFAGIFLTRANLPRAERLNLSIQIERNRLCNGDCKKKGR